MDNQHVGKHSVQIKYAPVIRGWSSIAGKKEGNGPLRNYFDKVITDSYFQQKSWELAERKLQHTALDLLLKKTKKKHSDIGVVLSGDLLNQCISSSSSLVNMNIPHLGLYGACSTMAESIMIGSMLVSCGFYDDVVAITSSHFASSERQYRFPLNYGGQRPPSSQWTVTGSGAVLLSKNGSGPKVTGCTIGSVVDFGVTDANNMGCAMAPAAFETIQTHFSDFNIDPTYYDYIVTGDLGMMGVESLLQLAEQNGINLSGKVLDCGLEIFDRSNQDVHSGGSGCGCSALVLCSSLLDQLNTGKLKRILFCGTGALLSPTSVQQGLSIPGVCHAVAIEGVI